MKKCSKCGEYKDFQMFHKDKNSKDGYKVWCKECRKKESLEYRNKYRDKILNSKKKWYEKSKNKKELRNKNAVDIGFKICTVWNINKKINSYRQRANGGYYSICRECENKKNKEYRKNNPDKINRLKIISENKRRYQKKQLNRTFTSEEWKSCNLFFNNQCVYCGVETNDLTQDHFIPISKGGEYSKNNILPSCRSCNSRKSNKEFYEWYKQDIYYSKERINKIEEYFRSL